MAVNQTEQRLRSELRRKNSALQNAISNAAVQKRLAESTNESPAKRAAARAKYETLQKQVSSFREEVNKLETAVKREQSRKEVSEVNKNYQRLKDQYDALLDKTSPEAKKLADRVNVEVGKLNSAYIKGGFSTRVQTISTKGTTTKPTTTANAPTGTTATKGTTTTSTTAGVSGTTAGTKGTTVTTGAKGATRTAGTAGTAGASGTAGVSGTDAGTKDKRTPDEKYADAIAEATRLYNMPDIIFKNIPSLGILLKKYVDGKLTDKQFQLELQNDPWVRQNSQEIKARYVQLFNYQDLVKTGRANGTTDYEQQIARISRTIQDRARQLTGSDISDADAKLMAQDLYIFNLDGDEAVVTERLARFIRPTAGMVAGQPTVGYGGEALKNYQGLQAIAKANGFKLEDILPRDAAGNPMTAESTLQAIATNKIDTTRLAQDVRKLAAQGQPEYVRQLLGQGYDLEQIYSPYKNRMASILEVNPDTIDLNDPALRMAIGKNGDMNLYDYEKALRKDNRWQYTKSARDEVAGSVMQVLRDFGFAGQ